VSTQTHDRAGDAGERLQVQLSIHPHVRCGRLVGLVLVLVNPHAANEIRRAERLVFAGREHRLVAPASHDPGLVLALKVQGATCVIQSRGIFGPPGVHQKSVVPFGHQVDVVVRQAQRVDADVADLLRGLQRGTPCRHER
jgi:hypothetical protein